jgi:CubicO group peptidase (beta-lactamase class C family)
MKELISKILLYFLIILLNITVLKAQNPNPSILVDNYIIGEMSTEKIPGMSTLIVKDGEIVWIESYGFSDILNNMPVTDSTVFLLASVSKVFTGTALMQLYENGQINLDEDINNYLPFSVDIPNHTTDSITFRMLMTHTSSIKDNGPVMDTYYSVGDPTISLADCMQRYFSTSGTDYSATANFHNNAPGTSFDYSNMGTALVGYLVEVISGMPFSQYCDINIFDEICMTNTSWYLSDFDTTKVARPYKWQGGQYVSYNHYGFADYPNGQLRSNITDMANFIISYLQNGSFNNQQILNSISVNEMLTLQIPNIENTQGLNWYTEEIFLSGGGIIDLWGHNGGEDGVSTDIYINPDNNIGIVVLSNGEGDNLYVVDELYDYALSLSTSGVGNPHCNATTAINENYFKDRTLTKIVSVLGREIAATYNTLLFYIYDDGTVEKRIIIE